MAEAQEGANESVLALCVFKKNADFFFLSVNDRVALVCGCVLGEGALSV